MFLKIAAIIIIFPVTLSIERLAQSNKSDVQTQLSSENWSLATSKELDSEESLIFGSGVVKVINCAEVASSKGTDLADCQNWLNADFVEIIDTQVQSMTKASDDNHASSSEYIDAIIRSLISGEPQKVKDIEVDAGLAVYQNWAKTEFSAPKITATEQDIGFGIETGISELKIQKKEYRVAIPETYQPFVRWKKIENKSDD